ncbi:MAG: helix-turn-helix transcriptional regulator, partial [Actinomadura rubrobrunea]|nr:helix-turn-helix transcriptional regulator [Actinomadura rubrobrunea]
MATWRRPRLAARRRAEGFTQETLAAELGADRTTVARWERCQCDPQPYYLPKLAESLNVTLAELHELLVPEPAPEGRATTPALSET